MSPDDHRGCRRRFFNFNSPANSARSRNRSSRRFNETWPCRCRTGLSRSSSTTLRAVKQQSSSRGGLGTGGRLLCPRRTDDRPPSATSTHPDLGTLGHRQHGGRCRARRRLIEADHVVTSARARTPWRQGGRPGLLAEYKCKTSLRNYLSGRRSIGTRYEAEDKPRTRSPSRGRRAQPQKIDATLGGLVCVRRHRLRQIDAHQQHPLQIRTGHPISGPGQESTRVSRALAKSTSSSKWTSPPSEEHHDQTPPPTRGSSTAYESYSHRRRNPRSEATRPVVSASTSREGDARNARDRVSARSRCTFFLTSS